ncbi:MAG: hypothetical protein ACE5KH_00745 [Candidatus Geothermarchaeales archaeon]
MSTIPTTKNPNPSNQADRLPEFHQRLSELREELELWEGRRREAHGEVKQLTEETRTLLGLTTRLEKERELEPRPW